MWGGSLLKPDPAWQARPDVTRAAGLALRRSAYFSIFPPISSVFISVYQSPAAFSSPGVPFLCPPCRGGFPSPPGAGFSKNAHYARGKASLAQREVSRLRRDGGFADNARGAVDGDSSVASGDSSPCAGGLLLGRRSGFGHAHRRAHRPRCAANQRTRSRERGASGSMRPTCRVFRKSNVRAGMEPRPYRAFAAA